MQTSGSRSEGLTKGRIEALTDGIFAFSMTLLVTGMDISAVGRSGISLNVRGILAGLYPDFIHYAIAFVTLAGFWVGHHAQYHHIRFIDTKLLWTNIFSLMFVALVPFSTSLAGDFPDDTLSALVLEVNLLIIGLLFFWQWSYACKEHRLVDQNLRPAEIDAGTNRNLVVPAISVLAIALALLNIQWSIAVYLLVPIILAVIPPRWASQRTT